MRTTLVLDDGLAKSLKEEAARRGLTMSALVESALRAYFARAATPPQLQPLVTFACGQPRVDVANRETLYSAMEDDDVRR